MAMDMGISESAVRQRVRQILDSGVARVTAITDPRSLGLPRRAGIGIRCTGDTLRLADQLANLPAITKAILTAGHFDAVVEVACE